MSLRRIVTYRCMLPLLLLSFLLGTYRFVLELAKEPPLFLGAASFDFWSRRLGGRRS